MSAERSAVTAWWRISHVRQAIDDCPQPYKRRPRRPARALLRSDNGLRLGRLLSACFEPRSSGESTASDCAIFPTYPLRSANRRSVRDLDTHKSNDPTRQQKKSYSDKYKHETAAEKCQSQRDQHIGGEEECGHAPLLCRRIKSRMGRLEVRKQQSQGNQIEQEQHDEGGAEEFSGLRVPHHRRQHKELATAHQERRIGEIASQPARVFPAGLRVGAEQDALVGRGAEGERQCCNHGEYANPLEIET